MYKYQPICIEEYKGSFYVKGCSDYFVIFANKKLVEKNKSGQTCVIDLGKYNTLAEAQKDYPNAYVKK